MIFHGFLIDFSSTFSIDFSSYLFRFSIVRMPQDSPSLPPRCFQTASRQPTSSQVRVPKSARDIGPQRPSALILNKKSFTKGGLAVVRPRRASSIRQTTLVSHGRVQDRALVSSSSKILPKEGLGRGHGRITARTPRGVEK